VLKELLAISEYPNQPLLPGSTILERTGTLIKTYGLVFIAVLIVAPLILATENLITHVLHLKPILHVGKDGMSRFIHKLGYWKAVMYISIIGPLLEETVFRLPLTLKRTHISLAFATAVFLFSGSLFHTITNPWINISVKLLVSAAIFFICMLLAPKGLSIVDNRFRRQLIILSMCLFGLMHIGNYTPIQWPLIWIYPIYVLPQLCMGWAITYIRFKNGFWWGFALHCLINSMSVLLSAGRFQ
jgi:hypothetical protein